MSQGWKIMGNRGNDERTAAFDRSYIFNSTSAYFRLPIFS